MNTVAPELPTTHEALESLLATLIKTARAGDWSTCHSVGEDFAIALEVHLRHEESVLFPRYAATTPAAAAEVEAFEAEHRRLRKFVGRLLVGVQHGVLRAESVDRVDALLREHDAHEAEHFGAWLESEARSLLGHACAHAGPRLLEAGIVGCAGEHLG